ncbi:MAG: bifunctional glutamate N-acetyltransferase/amino-acid acetyltransferase ArgJ [Methanomicrobiales archaeon]|nr:bifunctional glutamate N-acetyltransferase/amino-acid acetyltransferase ArgJ [Methanomicrobiales archaeon]
MKSICAIEGVECAGIREGKYGLALVRAAGTAAAVFTRNRVRAACIDLMRERIKKGFLEALVANSGCANAFTGKRGLQDAESMAMIAGDAMGIDPTRVAVASTGVIGRYLNLPLIERQCRFLAGRLARDGQAEEAAAGAIMTTDLVQKHALARRETFAVGGICKGSGMIAPNMGTMLAFIYTDASLRPEDLSSSLRTAAERTFNRVVVDGDTSTNDIAICTATGHAGRVNPAEFSEALEECCRSLAIQIAADGEGATKLIEVRVRGATGEGVAAEIARTIVASPLVKTAVYGEDPNWGRVMAAAGRAGHDFDPERVTLWIGEGEARVPLVERGAILADPARAKRAMQQNRVVFELDLGEGGGEASAWGCDLTERYVEINGRYTT